jgi:hypothetical protein
MAFLDPQSVPLPTAGTKSLPRIASDSPNSGAFQTGDGLWRLDVRTNYGKNTVHQIKLTNNKITSDPFKPAENRRVSGYITINFNYPSVGFTNADKTDMYKGLEALMAAGTYADLVKLTGGEV